MYGEEMDLSWRIWIVGESIIGVPEAKIHHRGAVGVNPDGGVIITGNRTSGRKRFLANRNRLLIISKNSQHILLLMFAPLHGTHPSGSISYPRYNAQLVADPRNAVGRHVRLLAVARAYLQAALSH